MPTRKDAATTPALFGAAPGAGFDQELDAMFASAPAPVPEKKDPIPREAEPAEAVPTMAADEHEADEAEEEDVPADAELEELSGAEDWDEDTAAAHILGTSDTSKKPKRSKPLLEMADDDDLARSKRTLFLGNVPVAALTSRSVRKQLLRHVESVSPYPGCTQVVSLRFRSVSFNVPTSDFSAAADEPPKAMSKRRERARKFRELQGESAKTHPPPLTAEQKRKIAYINQELNERADTVHAYVRLGEPSLVQARRPTAEPLDARLSGAVLTMLVARALDNTLFHGRHVRADVVQPLAPHEMIAAGLDQVRLPDGTLLSHYGASAIDPKRTVFVGNLDFEAQEEEVRALFEKLLRDERGEPPVHVSQAIRLDGTPVSSDAQPGQWVQSVRIVRDKATQLGKGFAYVKFVDPMCVDEMVALHEAEEAFVAAGKPQAAGSARAGKATKPIQLAEGEAFRRRLKLRKRALRVSRCKSSTGEEKKRRRTEIHPPQTPPKRVMTDSMARARSSGAPTPNGSSPGVRRVDPSKATYLSSLSKEQRALIKKNDPERQARRLEKKHAKKQAQKIAAQVGQGRERVKLPQRGAAKKMARVKSKGKASS
ncbi:maturation of LSU-rRNA from tricistronic rRNA transcript protein [Malassezia pachydermatis]|uniref:Nucleolar protein 12 n=1 Tax=Malassezia pachydermatis TaxID=77020 RepID=A0A0M8MVU4_9BASI|nr:rna-binding protein [Malassezia pachydermatis]KOS14601.1 rna-binding protein [Malassezia pachydermatis]